MAAFGYSNVCWKPIIKEVDTTSALFIRSLVSVSLLLFISLIVKFSPENGFTQSLSWNKTAAFDKWLLSGTSVVLSLAGLWLFIESMHHSDAGVSGVVVCCSSILSAITGWWWRDETFPLSTIMAFVLATVGVMLLDDWKSWSKPSVKGILLSLGGAFFWAISNLGFKEGTDNLGVLPFSLLQESIVVVLSGSGFAYRFFSQRKSRRLVTLGNQHRPLAIISLLTVAGVLCCNLGLNQLPIALFSLLVLVQPVTTLMSARFLLKERLTNRQWLGVLFIFCGIFIGLSAH